MRRCLGQSLVLMALLKVSRAWKINPSRFPQSNLEQCGACASAGGIDCTQIAGATAVGCVAGVCEVWACEDGYSFDATAASCVPF